MKYVFASDIHGSVYYTKALLEKFNESKAEKLILLGDLLYHGPRNDLPKDYAPKEVIAMLNPLKDKIYAVRGNCEAEVDQMVLDFPVMATYALLVLNGVTFYATHGHIYNPENLPPINPGEALIYGHVHLPIAEKRGDIYILNPGSTSIPKGGNPSSYAVLEDKHFQILTFDGQVIKEIDFE
jgi:phosphodiesterase family protein